MIRIACDVHTHTLFSRHAYSTLEEDVRAAANKNLELLGITDHYSEMLFDEQTLKNFQYFINLTTWPRVWHDVTLLRGCEADVVDGQGNLFGHDIVVDKGIVGEKRRATTLKHEVFKQCDYVIASIHRKDFTSEQTPAQNAQMYINALQDPKVLILGHLGRSGVDFELDPVLEAARDMGKLIELNGSSLEDPLKAGRSMDRCRAIAQRCAELGTMVSFGGDAHVSYNVARTKKVCDLLNELDFPAELVSCRSKEAFLTAARAAIPGFEL